MLSPRPKLPRKGTKARRCLELWFGVGGELQYSDMLREYCRNRDCAPRYASMGVQRLLKRFGTKVGGVRGSTAPWHMRDDVIDMLRKAGP